jgi:hypothetical protein
MGHTWIGFRVSSQGNKRNGIVILKQITVNLDWECDKDNAVVSSNCSSINSYSLQSNLEPPSRVSLFSLRYSLAAPGRSSLIFLTYSVPTSSSVFPYYFHSSDPPPAALPLQALLDSYGAEERGDARRTMRIPWASRMRDGVRPHEVVSVKKGRSMLSSGRGVRGKN